MKYVLSFVAAFVLVAGGTAFLRVRGGAPAAEPTGHVGDGEPAPDKGEPPAHQHEPVQDRVALGLGVVGFYGHCSVFS